jgi:thiol:disulfide interchange protein
MSDSAEERSWSTEHLKEFIELQIHELDLRFAQALAALDTKTTQHFIANGQAVTAALAAAEKAVAAAFEAYKEAIAKAEAAQSAYNDRSNEFRGALDDQAKKLLTRQEAESTFQELRRMIKDHTDQIAEVQRSQSRGSGMELAAGQSRDTAKWIIGLGITLTLALIGIAFKVFGR